MKTTIELNDALVRHAKVFAVLKGTMLRQVVEDALTEHLARAEADDRQMSPEDQERDLGGELAEVRARYESPGTHAGRFPANPSREEIYEERYLRTIEAMERGLARLAAKRRDRN